MGTLDTHYLKTVAGRVLQDNSSTLISVNKGRPIDTSAIFFMPELFFELCPRFGPLANEDTKKKALSLSEHSHPESVLPPWDGGKASTKTIFCDGSL